MKRFLVSLLFCLTILIFIAPKQTFASILFQDDFSSGNANNWTANSNLWHVQNGKYGAIVSNTGSIIKSTANFDITTSDYIIEYDIFPVQGVDKNIDFRFGSTTGTYEVHFTGGNATTNFGQGPIPYILQNHPLSDNFSYHIKIILQDKHFQFFVNSDKLFDKVDPNYHFSNNEHLGLIIGTGAAAPTEIYFDNVVVKTLDSDINLNVPYYKQTDPIWGSDIYDSADIWSPKATGIYYWGCAMTSAVMVFRYHGLTTMPDGSDLNPSTVNTWLKNETDGYVGDGLVNWIALTRLAKKAKDKNPNFAYDAFEFSRKGSESATLTDDLQNGYPDILEEPGHFIVGTGTQGNDFLINDPFYEDRPTLASYSGKFLSISNFKPSHTDLSYIMLVTNPNITITVKDPQGNATGSAFIQNPLINDVTDLPGGSPVKIFYLPKPASGQYQVLLSSNSTTQYSLKTFLYDVNANVTSSSDNGIISNNNPDIFSITFDKNNNKNSRENKIITPQSLMTDITELDSLKQIKLRTVTNALLLLANHILTDAQQNKKSLELVDINNFEATLKGIKSVALTDFAYQILFSDAEYLKTHL